MAKHAQYYFEGINQSVSPMLMKDAEVSLLINGYHPLIGLVQKRSGTAYVGDQTGTGDILGIHGAYTGLDNGSGGFKKYIYQVSTVSSTTSIKYLNGSNVWTALTGAGTSLTGGESFEMTSFINYTFVVSASNAPRTIAGSNGTTVSTATMLNGAPAYARHITNWYNRIYMADCTISSQRYPSRVYFSSIPFGIVTVAKGDQLGVTTELVVADNRYLHVGDTIDIYSAGTSTSIATSVTITAVVGTDRIQFSTIGGDNIYAGDEVWLAGTRASTYKIAWDTNFDWFSVAENDGEGINRIIGLGSQLLIFKPSSVWAYTESNLRMLQGGEYGNGAISGKSVAVVGQSCFFLSKEGFFEYLGGTIRKVSAKIDNIVAGISGTNLQNAVGYALGSFYYCYVASCNILNPDGSTNRTLSDVTFVYNQQQGNWSIYTGFEVNCATEYTESATSQLFLGSGSGRVLRAFTGTTDQIGSSSTQAIPFELETKLYYFGSPDQFLQFNQMHLISDMVNATDVLYGLDGGAFKSFQQPPENLVKFTFPDTAYGRAITLKFVENSKNPCRLFGFTIDYEEKEPIFEK